MKGLIGALLIVGLAVVYWQWALLAVVVLLIVKAAPMAWSDLKTEQAEERQRLGGLAARAEEQHQWAMSGDPRGTHGAYPPAFDGSQTV